MLLLTLELFRNASHNKDSMPFCLYCIFFYHVYLVQLIMLQLPCVDGVIMVDWLATCYQVIFSCFKLKIMKLSWSKPIELLDINRTNAPQLSSQWPSPVWASWKVSPFFAHHLLILAFLFPCCFPFSFVLSFWFEDGVQFFMLHEYVPKF